MIKFFYYLVLQIFYNLYLLIINYIYFEAFYKYLNIFSQID